MPDPTKTTANLLAAVVHKSKVVGRYQRLWPVSTRLTKIERELRKAVIALCDHIDAHELTEHDIDSICNA